MAADGLIGRRDELDALLDALARAETGQSGVVLVSGDAGVGKSRLVAELCAAARGRGGLVLTGQCAELGEGMPYLPLADALWTAARDPELPGGAAALRSALEARPVLGRLLPDGVGAAGGDSSDLAQQRLFGAVLGLLGELSDARPVLLVLEDLHWADRSTRDLLVFLSRVLQRERVCLIGTYRSDDLHRRHPLRPLVAELLRLPGVSAVRVRPFEREETAGYLASLGGGGLPAGVIERVHARSEGNPFYAAELLAAARDGEELPPALADLLLARVERLSECAQRVVRIAAVAGRRVDDRLLRRVSGLDEAECEQALREIVSHRLLLPDGTDGYAFRHALLREAVYGDLLPGERTRLHAAFAELLSGEDGRGSAAELAHHSLAALDLPTAFAASVQAARQAERVGAPAEAHEHYDRALSLWDRVPAPQDVAGTDRIRLSLHAAAASAAAGEVRRARQRVQRLLEAVDPGDRLLLSEVHERLAYYLGDLDRIEESIAAARTAVQALPPDPPTAQRARALATLARSIIWHGDHSELRGLAGEAIAAARATGAVDAEASALISLGLRDEPERADSGAEETFAAAWRLAHDFGDLQVALRAAFHRARARFDRRDLAGAREDVDEGVRFTLDTGLAWSSYGINMRFLQYVVYYTLGDWETAARIGEGFGVRVGTQAEASLSAFALFVDVARGAPAAGERLGWLSRLWDDDGFVAFIARGLAAERDLWNGDPAAALVHADAALRALLSHHDPAVIRIVATALWAHADLAAQARAAGDRAAAEQAVRAADGLIGRAREAAARTSDGRPRGWLGWEGLAWLARAEAEWHRTRGDDRPAHWRAALDAFDMGFVYEVARSRWRLAESLAAHGDREAAVEQWRRAVADADRLGAAPLRRALDDLGRRARLTGNRAAAGPSAGLTVREREVLELVARGLGNREIAAELHISPKTASVHVSNILAKLGVSGRTQAAAVALREGLVG